LMAESRIQRASEGQDFWGRIKTTKSISFRLIKRGGNAELLSGS
jgi:hypothetical protein